MIFSDWEKAALNLAEAITRDPITTVPDVVFHAACLIFNESEVICLILAILAVNDWHYLNRAQSPCLESVCDEGLQKFPEPSEIPSKEACGVTQANNLIRR